MKNKIVPLCIFTLVAIACNLPGGVATLVPAQSPTLQTISSPTITIAEKEPTHIPEHNLSLGSHHS